MSVLPPRLTESERTEMHRIIEGILGPQKAAIWWKAKNPMLGGISPRAMSLMGLERRVYQFVILARDLNQPPARRCL